MKRVAIMAGVLTGPAAFAEVAPQECHDPYFGGYDVAWHGGGFALFTMGRYDTNFSVLALDDCAQGTRLMMMTDQTGDKFQPNPVADAVHAAVDKAVRSKQRYTLGQIDAIARKAGARTELVSPDAKSCACERYGQ